MGRLSMSGPCRHYSKVMQRYITKLELLLLELLIFCILVLYWYSDIADLEDAD